MYYKGEAHLLKSIQKLTDKEQLQTNLVQASLFLTAFEVLKTSIVDQIRDFYSREIHPNGTSIASEKYKSDLLALHKNIFIASCLWLKENNAISEEDIETIHAIRDHRNMIAHELLKFLADADYEVDLNLFAKTKDLLAKIDRWWIMEVHIPTNPDYDGQSIQPDDVKSGHMIVIDAIVEILSKTSNSE